VHVPPPAFALGLLAVHDVAIYDGSMAEWAADPILSLVVGN
jgi:3-mercaptopyruvate sulfurtransferase SseA